MEYLDDRGILTKSGKSRKAIWDRLKEVCHFRSFVLEYEVEDVDSFIEILVEELNEWFELDTADVGAFVSSSNMSYAEGFDRMCVIVDRDRDSFSSDQYLDVIRKCERYGFDLYVTNPCFEFWLLLHFDGCDVLDREMLLCNYKTNGRSYTEKELSSRLGGYKKNRYNADGLMDRIDQAIENEKMFCEDVLELRESVGCNIGKLMTQMRERSPVRRVSRPEVGAGN